MNLKLNEIRESLRLSKKLERKLKDDEGNDVFFHVTGCVEPKFNDLREGMKVNYLLSTRNDKPIAIGIVGI